MLIVLVPTYGICTEQKNHITKRFIFSQLARTKRANRSEKIFCFDKGPRQQVVFLRLVHRPRGKMAERNPRIENRKAHERTRLRGHSFSQGFLSRRARRHARRKKRKKDHPLSIKI